MTTTATTTQVYRVYIKAPAEKIWQALTDPEWTNRYGYTGFSQFDLKPGGSTRWSPTRSSRPWPRRAATLPDVVVDGEVIEVDEPRRLVIKWRLLMDPDMAAEGFTRVTYEIKDLGDGACSLTLVHELEGSPEDGGDGRRRARGHRRRRRLGLGPQRPQVAAGDRHHPRREVLTGDPAPRTPATDDATRAPRTGWRRRAGGQPPPAGADQGRG